MKKPTLKLLRHALLGFFLISLSFGSAWSQQTITYNDGDNDATAYDTSAPNDPTTLTIGTGSAIQSGILSGTGEVIKTGAGSLTLSAVNTYTGGTTISAGELQVGNGGSTGSIMGNVLNNGFLIFNRSDDIAFGGTITGTGGLGKLGAGRLELTGSNSGGTGTFIDAGALAVTGTINHPGGSLVVANGAGTTATLEINGAGSVSAGTALVGFGDGSTGLATVTAGTWTNASSLVVGGFGAGTVEISGTGNVASDGGVLGNVAGSSGTVSVSGGSWINSGALGLGVSGAGLLEVSGTGLVSNTIGVIGTDTTSTGTATVSGGTWTNSTGLIIGDEGQGTVNLTGGTLNAPNIEIASDAGSTGTLNIGTGASAGILNATAIAGGSGTATVNFNHTGMVSFASNLTGSARVNKLGPGTTVLAGTNTYTGPTTISGGTLAAGNLPNSAVMVQGGGAFSPGGAGVAQSITVGGLSLDGGNLLFDIGTGGTDFISVADGLGALNAATQFLFTDNGLVNGTYALLDGLTPGWNLGLLSFSGLASFGGTFLLSGDGTQLFFSAFSGGVVSGALLQNTAPVGTPTIADFLVQGLVTTGTPTQNNVINSLIFDPNSLLQVFNNLTVTSGNFNVPLGEASIHGGNVVIPGDFNLNGLGTLIAGSQFGIGGNANINGGTLVINDLFNAGGNMNVNSTVTVNGNAGIGGDLNTNAGMINVNGFLGIGGSANLTNGTLLEVNQGGVMNVDRTTNLQAGSSATINGLLTSNQFSNNGLLKGEGLIAGNVLNSGTVAPGNSPGTLTINGTYTQNSSGIMEIETASPGNFDRLVVSGAGNLAGTLQFLPVGGFRPAYGQQFAFLQAGSISGGFDQILMPDANRFRGRFLSEEGVGTLLVAPTSYTLVAETTNQRNVAKALDRFIPARGDDRETVSIALDLQTEEEYPAAIDQIAPTYYESLGNIAVEQSFAQTQQMNQRFSAVRLGARGFQAMGVESPIVYDRDGKSVLRKAEVEKGENWNLWAMGNGLFGKVTHVSQVPNYRFDSGGFLFGADYTLEASSKSPSRGNPQLTVGVYGGYQFTWADAGNAGNTQINSTLFGGYANYSQGGFYADAIVGGGYSAYRVRRSIEFSTVDRTARSRPDGGQVTTSLNLGYDWQIRNFTLGPIAGVQYTYAGIAGFTETGADSLDLRLGQQNVSSLRTTLGGRIAYTWNITDKISLIPEVRMLWQHEFQNNPRTISAALDGGSGPTFGYETSAPARNSVFSGAGVSAQIGDSWNAFVYYNIDFGRQDYLGNMVSGGLGWKF